jgi:hypothetical protein
MPGLVPGIHVLLFLITKTWMAGTSPAMTNIRKRHENNEGSLHPLVGVDAPQPLLLDPAIEPVAGNVAPA